jgi:hypothetical protein
MKLVRTIKTVERLSMDLVEPESSFEQLLWHSLLTATVGALTKEAVGPNGFLIGISGGKVQIQKPKSPPAEFTPYFGWYGSVEHGVGDWEGEIALVDENGIAAASISFDSFTGVHLAWPLEAPIGATEKHVGQTK